MEAEADVFPFQSTGGNDKRSRCHRTRRIYGPTMISCSRRSAAPTYRPGRGRRTARAAFESGEMVIIAWMLLKILLNPAMVEQRSY